MKNNILVLLLILLPLGIHASDNLMSLLDNNKHTVSFPKGSISHVNDSIQNAVWPNASIKPISQIANRGVFSHNAKLHYTPNNSSIPYYLIIVENSLYNSISNEIKTYAEDAHAIYGYGIYVETVQYPTPEDVKSLIISYSNNLCGVFFVGDVGQCLFESQNDHNKYGYSNWPCDLYYMDLDGIWTDCDNNGIYDGHSGDVSPEIFMGRLSTVGLSSSGNEADLIRRQLQKSHNYWWKSSYHTSDTVLNYIDQVEAGALWLDNPSLVFSSGHVTTIEYGSNPNFSVSDYLSRISNSNYGFTHLAAHSDPIHHEFTDGNISVFSIEEIDSYNYAYNLNCCSACNWTHGGLVSYLGGAYLFNNGRTMTVVGTTKIGGMECPECFYSQFPTHHIGNAFLNWRITVYGNYYSAPNVSWSYGMTILGDPIIDFRHEVSNKCVNNLVLTSFPSNNTSNLVLYKAGNSITVSGNYIIPQGVHVIFDAPNVIFDCNFTCPLGASFETRNEGCEL